ncbi:MAG: hypothetical protein AB7D92_06205 [Sphaerochaeta sp.]
MKYFLCCAVMALSFSLLVASSMVKSNSIGQELGAYTESDSYQLVIDADDRQLWKQDTLLWTEQRSKDAQDRTVITRLYHTEGTPSSSKIFSDGHLIRQEEGPHTYSYYYGEDGMLEQVNSYLSDTLQESLLFSYASSSGRLIAVITIKGDESSIRYFNQEGTYRSFTYADREGGQTFLTLQGESTIEKPFSATQEVGDFQVMVEETGAFSVTRSRADGTQVQETYNEMGLLVFEKDPSRETEYRYNEENVLLSEHTTLLEGKEMVTRYEKGEKTMVEEREAGRTTSILRFMEDGTRIQTLYSEGFPYCDITYASGGKRILSISYR